VPHAPPGGDDRHAAQALEEVECQDQGKGRVLEPLILVSRDAKRLESVRDKITSGNKIDVLSIVKDLSEPSAPREIFYELNEAEITVGMLVNCAGSTIHGNFHGTVFS